MFSIITVVRNNKLGLIKTYESLLLQDDDRFEWIVIDGDSDDGTLDFLSSLKPEFRIRYRSLPANGIYNAMNFGALIAEGSFLLFLNAGDIMLGEGAVTRMLDCVSGFPNIELFASCVLHFAPNNYIFDFSWPNTTKIKNYNVANFNHQGTFVSRDAFLELKGFDESLKYAADGKFLDTTIKFKDFRLIPDIFVGYEVSGASQDNYSQVLREIETYRPVSSKIQNKIFILKTLLRLFFFRLYKLKILTPIANKILAQRQGRLIFQLETLLSCGIYPNPGQQWKLKQPS